MELTAAEWLKHMRREYLESFIPAGGAAVKFVVPYPPLSHEEIIANLNQAAEANGLLFVFADSASTRIHLIDRLFHDIARQLDWDDLAYVYLSQLLSRRGYAVPTERSQFSLSTLAERNGREDPLFQQDIHREIANGVFRDYSMAQEFRFAMIGLSRGLLDPGGGPLPGLIKDWLLGDLPRISGLKPALIFQQIARHNARPMLYSLTHWLKLAGKKGLLLGLDITRYGQDVRPPQRDEGNYYTAAAALEAYEELRELVDGTDEMESCFMAVIAGQEFLTDERRGVKSYQALYLRIADEVHDQQRDNPLASLVRLHGTENEIGREDEFDR